MEQEQESQTEQQEPIHLPKEYQNNPHFFLSKKVLLPDPVEAIDEIGIEEHEEDSNQNEQSSIIEKREDVDPSRVIPSEQANELLYKNRWRGRLPKALMNDPVFMAKRKEAMSMDRKVQMALMLDVKADLEKIMNKYHIPNKSAAVRYLLNFHDKYSPIQTAVENKMRAEILLMAEQKIK